MSPIDVGKEDICKRFAYRYIYQ